MYNRYIPQPDGSYRRNRMEDIHQTPSKPDEHPQCDEPPAPISHKKEQRQPTYRPQQHPQAKDFLHQLLPQNLDTGDLMIILLLLLMAGDCQEDRNTALLTLAIYLFM